MAPRGKFKDDTTVRIAGKRPNPQQQPKPDWTPSTDIWQRLDNLENLVMKLNEAQRAERADEIKNSYTLQAGINEPSHSFATLQNRLIDLLHAADNINHYLDRQVFRIVGKSELITPVTAEPNTPKPNGVLAQATTIIDRISSHYYQIQRNLDILDAATNTGDGPDALAGSVGNAAIR